jgi:predicted KAP-like P-loop ATPase
MPDASAANGSLESDRPINAADQDRLGFSKVADHLAGAFLQNDLAQGFVVGVEGSWGSGKSSLVNLALRLVDERKPRPTVVRFQPWLVGSRGDLLSELFAVLSTELAERGGIAGTSFRENARKFARAARGLGTVADLAESVGAPALPILRKLAHFAARKADELAKESLFELKLRLAEDLKNLETSVIIFIDDLDRLDPAEAVEVLRLVRAVADFPNVGYILAYDPDVLSHNIERALGVKDGRAYVEKIVQASFRVPMPMDYDLRNWLGNAAGNMLGLSSASEDSRNRFEHILFLWAPLVVKTPRDVVRALNALRLYALPVLDQTDPADMVFLQLARLKKPDLYQWIEEYAAKLSALSEGRAQWRGDGTEAGKALLSALPEPSDGRFEILAVLREVLPGLPLQHPDDQTRISAIFQDRGPIDFGAAIRDKRLASPNHFSYYFRLSELAGTLSDHALRSIIDLLHDDRARGVARLKELCAERRPQGSTMGILLLDRIGKLEEMPEDRVWPVLFGLSEVMDEAERDFGMADRAFRLDASEGSPFGLIRFLRSGSRQDALVDFVRESPSLVWVNGIIRSATFDHGFYGDRPKPADERLLTDDEFDAMRSAYLDRLDRTPAGTILDTPALASLLYGWSQAGAQEKVKAWVAAQIDADEGLVDLLQRLTGNVNSSRGSYLRIEPMVLTELFPSDHAVHDRLQLLSPRSDTLGERARTCQAWIAAASRC